MNHDRSGLQPRFNLRSAVLLFALCFAPVVAHAQIFVLNQLAGSVQKYNLDGTLANGSFITGLTNPEGIAVSSTNIYITDYSNNTVLKYNIDGTGGGTLIGSLHNPIGIAVSGTDLYIANSGNNTIAKYTTSGTLVSNNFFGSSGLSFPQDVTVAGSNVFVSQSNAINEYTTSGGSVSVPLISDSSSHYGIAVSGSNIFVSNGFSIGEYTTGGSTVNANLISSGITNGRGIYVDGSVILLANYTNGTISEYTTSGGVINSSFITGSAGIIDVAVLGAIPEASTYAALLGASAAFFAVVRHRRKKPTAPKE